MHHLAFAISQATFAQTVERLDERAIRHSGVKDRGFMDSIYFTDPLGLLIELASYRFEPPAGHTHADVLLEAHRIRVARGDYNIARVHLADAIERLVARARVALRRSRRRRTPTRTRDPSTPRRPTSDRPPEICVGTPATHPVTVVRRFPRRGADAMPDHRDKPPSALAHGPAKTSDIERVRRDVDEVAVRAVHEEEVSVVRRRLRVSDRTADHEEDARA